MFLVHLNLYRLFWRILYFILYNHVFVIWLYNMFLVHVNVCDFADTMLIVVQINLIWIWFEFEKKWYKGGMCFLTSGSKLWQRIPIDSLFVMSRMWVQ